MTQKKWWQRLLPHTIALLIFLLAAIVYSTPAFNHKVLVQEDMTQWRAMSHSSFQFKDQHGHFPLWTESMFSGMPAYMIAMEARAFAPQYYVLDLLTLHLPKPASFFFLACISMYFLALVLRINPYIGIISGLAYAYATYNPVIISVGHDTKMQAIALLPAFIGGLMLIYEKKYGWGAALTALCTAMIVAANHMQIFYYGLIIAGGMTAGYTIRWIIQKERKHLVLSGILASTCLLTGILCNAVVIFTTADLSKATIRGGSELASDPSTSGGLSNDYAFSYSLYPSESFILLVPKLYGGSSGPELTADHSKAIATLHQLPEGTARDIQQQDLLTFYWGGIGGTAGPAYAGAIICFFALLGMFVLDHTHKWWMAATALLAIFMSWGGYFADFNGLLLKYLPMYNKFRAPSVILVIPVFLLNVLAALSLQRIFTSSKPLPTSTKPIPPSPKQISTRFKQGILLTIGILLILLWMYLRLDYMTWSDRQFLRHALEADQAVQRQMQSFLQALRDDRKMLFLHSLVRSFLFIAAAALTAWLYIKGKIKSWMLLSFVGILTYTDLITTDVHYLNNDNYKPEASAPGDQVASPADQLILQDTGYFRVFDLRYGTDYTVTYGAATAWHHRSIGGYHAAKLSIYQDLIEHQLSHYPRSQNVVNMLNTRYLIGPGDSVIRNEGALGPAWFVQGVKFGRNPKEVMDALTDLDTKDTAVLFQADSSKLPHIPVPALNDKLALSPVPAPSNNLSHIPVPAPSDKLSHSPIPAPSDKLAHSPAPDTADKLQLTYNANDEMIYQSSTARHRFAVFSEIYYQQGWKAYIDGTETPIFRTNYVLRGITVPPGRHTIRFIFHPRSYYLGQMVQRTAGILTLLLLISMIYIKLIYPSKVKTA